MKLLVYELASAGITQKITVLDKNIMVTALRPHLYRHNFATGDLYMEIRDSNNRLISTSEVIPIASIGTEDYFHGYVRFYIDCFLRAEETYQIALLGTNGYTFSNANFIGWANDYGDLRKVNPSYTVSNIFDDPLDLEIWEKTEARRAF